jgi:hypothetical protein
MGSPIRNQFKETIRGELEKLLSVSRFTPSRPSYILARKTSTLSLRQRLAIFRISPMFHDLGVAACISFLLTTQMYEGYMESYLH